MSTPVRSILKQLDNSKIYDILTFINNPYYDTMFAQADHNFHLYNGRHIPSQWNNEVLPKPPNYNFTITPDIPINIDCNFILIHNKFHQFDVGKLLSRFWHLPVILVHQVPPRELKFNMEWKTIQNRIGNLNIYLGPKIQEEWDQPGFIINPGIGIPEYNEKKHHISHILCKKEEQGIINNLVNSRINYVSKFNFGDSLIFINTTTNFFPIHMLHAMSAGALVITQRKSDIEDIIQHEENGILIDDPLEIPRVISVYKNQPGKCAEIGMRARQTIIDKYNTEQFLKSINIAFKQITNITYVR